MKGKNEKVPVAVLSCFLIAFILQGLLKICGVFVFEKALDWSVFKIIDNTLWLQIIYYSLIVLIIIYCLSFSLVKKPYSKKWYHYVIMVLGAFGITCIKFLLKTPIELEFVFDSVAYVLIPAIITLTTNKDDRVLGENTVYHIVVTFALHILLYFGYLGLTYWSNLLCSIHPYIKVKISASNAFLTRLEVYVALFALMLSPKKFSKKMEDNMNWPIDIASRKAKLEAKKEKLEKELAKINADLEHLNSEDNK